MRIPCLLTLAFLVSCTARNTSSIESEILWDSWGIPHIYGQSEKEVYKMMGWAQMKNHGDLILRLYGEARGRSNEYWEGNFDRDYLMNQLGLVDASKQCYNTLTPSTKEIVDAFTEGLNSFATKFPELLDKKYKVVLPLTPEDVIAHSFRVFYLEFLINRNLQEAQQWVPGSNAWAINNDKTAANSSMLLANPHLPWQDFWLFFEAHLITETNDLYGATLVGLPLIGIGFNKHLGWTHTVNTLDNVDLYEITVNNGQYEMDGTFHDFESEDLTMIRRTNGMTEEIVLTRKRSAFGMIIKEQDDKALAIRWPNMKGESDILAQWKAMGEAHSLEEFKNAIKTTTLPLFNIIYSDIEGNILYHFGGNIPKKNGDWNKWQSIVTSNSSEDIWHEYYSADEVPSFENPAGHWIQNANDPPFTSTIPGVEFPADYPSHIAPNHMSFRAQRSANLIKDAKGLTLDEFIALKHDTRSELFLRIKDNLLALKDRTDDSLTLKTIDILTAWDGTFDQSSEASMLFVNLMNKLNTSELFEREWSFNLPLNTPDEFKDPENVMNAIKQAGEDQLKSVGNLKARYGDHFKVRVGRHEYESNGGRSHLGLFRTMHHAPGENGKFYGYGGDSYVCATEFGTEIKAKALLAYGNATQPGNPHIGDQLKLYSDKKLRDVWLSRKVQEENLELRERLEDM